MCGCWTGVVSRAGATERASYATWGSRRGAPTARIPTPPTPLAKGMSIQQPATAIVYRAALCCVRYLRVERSGGREWSVAFARGWGANRRRGVAARPRPGAGSERSGPQSVSVGGCVNIRPISYERCTAHAELKNIEDTPTQPTLHCFCHAHDDDDVLFLHHVNHK